MWRVVDPNSVKARLTNSELVSQSKPNVLRREKTEVLRDLPPQIPRVQFVELDGAQLRNYEELEAQARKDVRAKLGMPEKALRTHIFSLLTSLKQLCVFDAKSGESAKVEWLLEMLDEMHPAGLGRERCEKALIFSQYSHLVGRNGKYRRPSVTIARCVMTAVFRIALG